jgi:hypothetical protein
MSDPKLWNEKCAHIEGFFSNTKNRIGAPQFGKVTSWSHPKKHKIYPHVSLIIIFMCLKLQILIRSPLQFACLLHGPNGKDKHHLKTSSSGQLLKTFQGNNLNNITIHTCFCHT